MGTASKEEEQLSHHLLPIQVWNFSIHRWNSSYVILIPSPSSFCSLVLLASSSFFLLCLAAAIRSLSLLFCFSFAWAFFWISWDNSGKERKRRGEEREKERRKGEDRDEPDLWASTHNNFKDHSYTQITCYTQMVTAQYVHNNVVKVLCSGPLFTPHPNF